MARIGSHQLRPDQCLEEQVFWTRQQLLPVDTLARLRADLNLTPPPFATQFQIRQVFRVPQTMSISFPMSF